MNGLLFEGLEAYEVTRLEEPFSKEEVLDALSGFRGDKALGPNVFFFLIFFYGILIIFNGFCEG